MVHAVAAAVPTIDLDAADAHLDIEHYSYLLCLALAHTRTAVGGSRLDYAVGIWIRGSNCRSHRFPPDQAIGRTAVLSGPGKVMATALHTILGIQ
jgi:hypothetical protein